MERLAEYLCAAWLAAQMGVGLDYALKKYVSPAGEIGEYWKFKADQIRRELVDGEPMIIAAEPPAPSPAAVTMADALSNMPGALLGFQIGREHAKCPEFIEMMDEFREFAQVLGENVIHHLETCGVSPGAASTPPAKA